MSVGDCPSKVFHPMSNKRWKCGCRLSCALCGNAIHSGVHMPAHGGTPGTDPAWDHEFKPRKKDISRLVEIGGRDE